jgi:hypothetical protein
LFDSLSILSRRDVLFSNGNLAARGAEIGSTAEFFEHLPFQQIYHDTWLSDDEKRSVVFSRHAEVAVRDELDLGPLLRIWCRSAAERETLQSLVSSSIWASYAQRIGSSARPNLFFRRWTFVEHAVLSDERINLRLNPSSRTPGPFSARLELFDGESLIAHWSDLAFASTKYGKTGDLIVRLPQRLTSYTVRFLLDELLVYAGSYAQEQDRVALF